MAFACPVVALHAVVVSGHTALLISNSFGSLLSWVAGPSRRAPTRPLKVCLHRLLQRPHKKNCCGPIGICELPWKGNLWNHKRTQIVRKEPSN